MTRVPTEIVESAHLDGHWVLRGVFSYHAPDHVADAVHDFDDERRNSVHWYMHSLLLTNGGQAKTGTLGLMVIQTLRTGNMYYSAAISVLLSLISIPLMLSAKKFLNKIYEDVEV